MVIGNTLQHINQLGLDNSSARLLPKDTICLSRTASVGYVVKMGRAMATSQDFVTWSCGDTLDPDFLMQALLAEGEGIRRFGEGSTHTTIYFPEVKALHVALPPLPEQRRIVAKIDSLTGKSRRASDQLNHIPRLVEKYKQSVLAAAFRGDLTRVRRAAHLRTPWSSTTVGHLVRDIVAGKNLRCEERPPTSHELGVVKISAVTWGAFDPAASKTLPSNFIPPENGRIRLGDLLITRANTLELVGAAVIVDQAPGNLFLSDKVLRLEMDDADKRWLMWFLRSPMGRAGIEAGATGNQLSMRNLSQSALRAIGVPWPDAEEREEIVRRIETAFAWIDRLAAEGTSARQLIDRLEQSVLAKAFRGELVPQDPDDEPASVLLERIRLERGAVPKVKRGRRVSALRDAR
jgi:type I restriction enzyme S subunit